MPSFLADLMLLRLGRWLRMMGQDAANADEGSDDRELLKKAREEKRTLITRDRRLAGECRAAGVECILIKSSRIEEQLEEMAELGITLGLDPHRCTLCNGPLQKIDCKERATWRCEGCGKLYWKGSHWKKMEKMLGEIRDNIDKSNIDKSNIDKSNIDKSNIDKSNIDDLHLKQ